MTFINPKISFGFKKIFGDEQHKSILILKPKADYSTLNPVIGLTITDFKMFDEKGVAGVLSRFELYDPQNELTYPMNDIALVFVELPKFKKTLLELKTLTDKWLYFMRYANELDDVPLVMEQEPPIALAFDVANRVNLSQEESDDLEKREFFVRDMARLVEQAVAKAERIATEQAEKKAEKALEKGRKEGKQEGVESVARQLLDILDDETISQKTGLSVDQVRTLRLAEAKS